MKANMTLANHSVHLPGGFELAYLDAGRGANASAPVIVLLHGYCGSSAYWEQLVPRLKGTGRIIAPDLRGHGGSDSPSGDVFAMEDFADDLASLLELLDPGKVILLGHSLGGYVTLAFAQRYRDRLAAFGLIHSTALPDGEEARAGRDKAARSLAEEGIRPFIDGLVPKLFAPDHRESMPEAVSRVKEIGYGTDARAAAATAMGMKARPDRRDVLEAADLPVLIAAGEQDGVVPPEKAFAVKQPAISERLLAGSGHMSMMEDPGALADAIAEFAARAGDGTI